MLRNLSTALVAVLLLFSQSLLAQRTCGANEVLIRQLQENPLLQEKMDEIERQTEQFIQNGLQDRVVVTIPVVVNVVYNTTSENISDNQILTQIQVLNDDFRRLNADKVNTPSVWTGIAADCEINFCLATQDPSGAATTGIRRQFTNSTSFSTNDAVKFTAQGGLDAWSRDKYLNIWVCDLSGGLLGYAQFPGGAPATDGVVIDYQYFGTTGTATAPFDKGRTGTHEVGHWLNLYHIWGDDGTSCNGSDLVGDTPNQADEHYACPSFPQVSCSNGPNGDMFMNYMDYTDDACMNLFTAGQKSRMQALFNAGGFRAPLLSSTGCQPPNVSCGAPASQSASNITTTSATLSWSAVSGATAYNLQWKLASAGTYTTVSNLTTTSYNLTGLSAATAYNYRVQAVCGANSGNYTTASTFTTASGSCTDNYENNNTRSKAKTIAVGTTITAKIGTSTDVDWFKFANTSSQRNIKVELTNLPFDYDLDLYRGSTYLTSSTNGGTQSETLIYNTSKVSTSYHPRVYGYNGAFSSTACYNLKVTLSSSAFRTDGSTDGELTEFEVEVPVELADKGFSMYPNPAADRLTVLVAMESDSDVSMNVVDASGKVVLQQHRSMSKADNQFDLDLGGVANGVYFVQIRSGEATHTRKLVVQR